jgi:predicted transcriptional regulator of viral defense system
MATPPSAPSWDQLYEVAAAQEGLFTTAQASDAGYSPELLIHHLRSGKFRRIRRGIYRLTHFPAGEHEDLVAIWLWSEQSGVFSHQTALFLHQLSDVLPVRAHLTLPSNWRRRRFRVPPGVVLHHADVAEVERGWVGAVPVTAPLRALVDCATTKLSPDLLEQAIREALSRGLATTAITRVRRDRHCALRCRMMFKSYGTPPAFKQALDAAPARRIDERHGFRAASAS